MQQLAALTTNRHDYVLLNPYWVQATALVPNNLWHRTLYSAQHEHEPAQTTISDSSEMLFQMLIIVWLRDHLHATCYHAKVTRTEAYDEQVAFK